MLAGAVGCTTAASLCDESAPENAAYRVAFLDSFDSELVDTEKWTVTVGNEVGQLRDSYGSADNVYTEDGKLVMQSNREKHDIYDFTSGMQLLQRTNKNL